MKKTALLLLSVLSLAACAPFAAGPKTTTPPPPTTPALPPTAVDGSTLTITAGAAYQTITLENGTAAATASTVRLVGGPLRVNDKRCAVDGQDLLCTLGALDPAQKRVIYATGVSRAHAELTREGGSVTALDATP